MSETVARFPKKLRPLFEPSRYKVLYGGRGGAKSWGIARALLLKGAESPLSGLCAREMQNSIKDSSHALLKNQIANLGLSDFYEVLATEIRGKNGTSFVFAGLKHNVDSIKSKEGIDICWVEEAHKVSRSSWETLIPTIRKDGSEIWVSFNPDLEDDDTYQRFIVRPPTGAVLIPMSYEDNPYFPPVLEQERLDLLERDPVAYGNVWLGQPKLAVTGAVYGAELAKAREEKRITTVPYDPSAPVHTFWDLGWADSVSVWMAQTVGLEFRIIDYLEGSQKPIDWYVAELGKRPYVWGEDWLPHDAQAQTLQAAGRTIESQMIALGRKVRIVEKIGIADGINAARNVFGRCWFDQDKCADGLHALRHYRYDVEDDPVPGRPTVPQLSRKPLHDWASHPADAFRYLAVSIQAQRPKKAKRDYAGSWMG